MVINLSLLHMISEGEARLHVLDNDPLNLSKMTPGLRVALAEHERR